MKKLIIILGFIGLAQSLYAYRVFENTGNSAYGDCSNGSAWSANADYDGYWAAAGPKGTTINGPISKSLDVAVRAVCGE